jgi:thymidylate synthase ThyX
MYETDETFSDQQRALLDHYVTNTSRSIFVLRNLPEVIKGALFSRYSRSSLGLRSLLLKEFIDNDETAFSSIAGSGDATSKEQHIAVKKAQNFYDRILDGYGDDSIGELGGAHLAIENVSMLGAKAIEDARIGGSPLEKSTRYIYFDQKVGDSYLYYKEPILLTSAYRELYTSTCDALFETYKALIPPLTELIEASFPRDEAISKVAYTAALRAKVLDCLRGLLPAGTLTNMGVYGNGRFFDSLLQRLAGHSLTEMRDIGQISHEELSHVIPSFIRRSVAGSSYQQGFATFKEGVDQKLATLAQGLVSPSTGEQGPYVRLLSYDIDGPARVAAALLFPHTGGSLLELQEMSKRLDSNLLDQVLGAAAEGRTNRRHKSPRGLEHASFTFELCADFGVYRDLHRHRMATQERQLLTASYGYYTPREIEGTAMEAPYREAMERAGEAYTTIAAQFPEEAQYVVPMGYNIRWYFHINLRSLQWLCELRSAAAGHPTYRYIAQEMAKQVSYVFPEFERFFAFVDYEGYELGRLGQEVRNEAKAARR